MGYRIIELSPEPHVDKGKSDEQPYCMERKADSNALGGETWLPVSDNSPAGRALLRALVETVRKHEAEKETHEGDDC
jgi:hypothetical protein